MIIFKCEKCGCAENTVLCRYWIKQKEELALCSECDPKGQQKWHNCFLKKPFKEIKKVKHDR